MGGRLHSPPVPYRNADGRVGWVHITGDGSLWFTEHRFDDTFSAWKKIEGTTGAKGRPATLKGSDGRVRIFHRTGDGCLYEVIQQDLDTPEFDAPRKLTDDCAGPPAATLTGNGSAGVFYLTADGKVGHLHPLPGASGGYTVSSGDSTWPKFLSVVVALDGSGCLVLGGEGVGGTLHVLRQKIPDYGDWTIKEAHASNVGSEISAVADAAGRVFLFYRSGDGGKVCFVAQDAARTGFHPQRSIGGTAKGGVGAALDRDNRINVTVLGTDNALHLNVQSSQAGHTFEGFSRLGDPQQPAHSTPLIHRGLHNLLHLSIADINTRQQLTTAQHRV
ncbi:hypothetical protein B4N89_46885 [Embleya scabrispora]|uniref:PLL-like beta propeller domain-containing protein n=1 Tax=Embleya scabrispora TaxID=159449 RepID=A0A1T3NIN5_9ACTN|nr:hypothetical protein [Embleya scabrispora]OPC76540.1 hypothetical protein B4N89_46885 [Embleya scabrispora]